LLVTDILFILARFWSCNSSLFNDWAMGLIIKESQFDSHISKRFHLLQNVQNQSKGVAEFIYLGTLISNDNSIEKEIQKRILAGNRTYFAAISLFRSRLLSRATKIILYKTLIRLVVSYGVEAWTMTKKDEQALLAFERKIFRRIYGPKYENGEWKSRTN